MNVTISFDVEIKAIAQSGYSEDTIKARVDELVRSEQTDAVVAELDYLASVMARDFMGKAG